MFRLITVPAIGFDPALVPCSSSAALPRSCWYLDESGRSTQRWYRAVRPPPCRDRAGTSTSPVARPSAGTVADSSRLWSSFCRLSVGRDADHGRRPRPTAVDSGLASADCQLAGMRITVGDLGRQQSTLVRSLGTRMATVPAEYDYENITCEPPRERSLGTRMATVPAEYDYENITCEPPRERSLGTRIDYRSRDLPDGWSTRWHVWNRCGRRTHDYRSRDLPDGWSTRWHVWNRCGRRTHDYRSRDLGAIDRRPSPLPGSPRK